MSYDPRAIANRFLVVAKSCGQELTPMKIQKLVYYAHGWHLAIKATSLIDEQVEAWPFGPVIPSLYHAFRHFGRLPVTAPAVIYSFRLPTTGETEEEDIEFCEKVPNINDDPEQSRFVGLLIQRIWEVYGNFTAIQLSNMTHEPGTPWHQVVNQSAGRLLKGTDIPATLIRDHFISLAKNERVANA